jgi:hypothetical protein
MSKPNKTPEQIWEESKQKTINEAKAAGITKLKPWQIVYRTIERWSNEYHDTAALKKLQLVATSQTVKDEITNAARAVKKGTHEQINSSSQAEFLINVAIGNQVSRSGKAFERKAKLKDGGEIEITYLAEKHRLRTSELLVEPELIQDIANVSIKTKDRDQYVQPGHTGAGYFGKGKPSQSNQVVSSKSAASGKDSIHQAQIEAMEKSSTQLGLSHRLSKVRDEFQEDGTGIVKAEESKGFHPDTSWKGFNFDSKESVLVAAVTANQIFKKSQTKEKKIREPLAVPPDLSEDYKEIRTESETRTDDHEDYIRRKVMTKPEFKSFADKHKIDTTGKSFVDKAKSLNKTITKDGR